MDPVLKVDLTSLVAVLMCYAIVMAVVAPLKAVHRDHHQAYPLIPGHANQGLSTTKTLFISTAGALVVVTVSGVSPITHADFLLILQQSIPITL